jgi:hypothetical protein
MLVLVVANARVRHRTELFLPHAGQVRPERFRAFQIEALVQVDAQADA